MGYNFDDLIVEHYAPQLLRPLKFGENGVFFWIPGSGMTSVVNNLFTSKSILRKFLPYSKLLNTISFWGHLAEEKSLAGLIKSAGFENYFELERECLKTIESGKEMVCILGRIDDYTNLEKISILKQLLCLTSKNRHRIHILFFSFDKPWFEEQITKHPELIILANYMEIIPILSGEILKGYIKETAAKYEYDISQAEIGGVCRNYGGMIQLVKEYIRSSGKSSLLETKFRVNWNDFPKPYKIVIEQNLLEQTFRKQSNSVRDLKEFGVLSLKVFSQNQLILNLNPEVVLSKLLTVAENTFWQYLKSHKINLITKEKVINILRSENSEDISLWAVDQAISRFRKKLDRAGIDSELLRTVKGKGYIWKG